ncbi:MAG TPA: ABC transporter permease [Spirochaetales bacterium]|mgnify:CR=1 FL=1|nr:ABC transporter permease [Spirochaetales bacterium]HPS14175.1 ABC transporter permease [Spirochaetales bacterium]
MKHTKKLAEPARRDRTDKLDNLLANDNAVSVIVVLLGLLFGTLLIILVGKNPSGMYSAMLQTLTGLDIERGTWNARYIGEWLTASLPLILCGLSFGFAARTGLFNIGAEGQYIAGLTAAQFVALYFPPIPILHWVVALIAAAIAGALFGGLVGWLKARFEVSEVVATIMLNYIAFFLSRWATMQIPGSNTYKTPSFPASAMLTSNLLQSLTNDSRLSIGFWVTILCCILYWFIIEKTKLGFELRATGYNKEAARCSGIKVTSRISISMILAGVFAGLAGAIVALGSFSYGRVLAGLDNYGFNGIAAALVGNNTGLGTFLAGLLFGMLASAQPLMQSRQIPKEITWIISGLVVVLISLRAGAKLFLAWRAKNKVRMHMEIQTASDAASLEDSLNSGNGGQKHNG